MCIFFEIFVKAKLRQSLFFTVDIQFSEVDGDFFFYFQVDKPLLKGGQKKAKLLLNRFALFFLFCFEKFYQFLKFFGLLY